MSACWVRWASYFSFSTILGMMVLSRSLVRKTFQRDFQKRYCLSFGT